MDMETYDSVPFTRWLDKSGKPIEDHPEFSSELQETTILKGQPGVPVEILLMSKLVKEPLRAKGYDLEEVKKGKATIGQDLTNLLRKLADHKPIDSATRDDEPEVTIIRMKGVSLCDKNLMNAGDLGSKEVVRTLVEKIPEETLEETTLRRKRVSFKEDAEEFGLAQESGKWLSNQKEGGEENLPGESEDWDDDSVECEDVV